jgi:hypothetical protein
MRLGQGLGGEIPANEPLPANSLQATPSFQISLGD